jgi:hypothetical protein
MTKFHLDNEKADARYTALKRKLCDKEYDYYGDTLGQGQANHRVQKRHDLARL